MTIKEFRLPDPGEGLVEADIVTWRVAVGDQVKINDILLEVETSKSLVELPSPYAGTVAALLVSEGETVDVGRPVITIDDGQQANDEPEGRVPNLVGYGPRAGDTKRRARRSTERPEAAEISHEQAAHTFDTDEPVSRRADDRAPLLPDDEVTVGEPLPTPGVVSAEPTPVSSGVLAKPPVRKLAKDLGVDLAQLTGSGAGGVITRDDVISSPRSLSDPPRSLSLSKGTAGGPSTGSGNVGTGSGNVGTGSGSGGTGSGSGGTGSGNGGETRIPIKGVRKATAQAMVDSAFTAPHVSVWVTCDVTATMELIDRLKVRREFRDVKITPLLIIAKAVALALQQTPELNSAWDEPRQEIVLKHAVNLGIAAATPRGLMVPNIKQAQSLNLRDLAAALTEVITKARDGRSQPADLSGGTFTITNIGVFNVDAGTPILNPGEAGILCVGQIARRPWVIGTGDQERIEPRWVTTLAASFDHRLADGEQGSRFLSHVAQLLSDPGLALLH